MHRGVDIKLAIGDTVRAAFAGQVRFTNYERRGYGYYVVMRHTNGLETIYGHLSRFLVKEGDIVKVGDPIALGGNTGRSTGAHLHFEVRFLGLDLNPNEIFDFNDNKIHNDIFVFRSAPYRAGTETYYANGVTYSGLPRAPGRHPHLDCPQIQDIDQRPLPAEQDKPQAHPAHRTAHSHQLTTANISPQTNIHTKYSIVCNRPLKKCLCSAREP